MTIGSIIREIRKKKGITQLKMSKMVKMSQTSMCLIETNRKNPSPATLVKISKALGMPIAIMYIMILERKDVVSTKRALYDEIYPVIKDMLFRLIP